MTAALTDEQLGVLVAAASNTVGVVAELAARWHRHANDDGSFTTGMRRGWVQAIALLAGTTTSDIYDALKRGEL